MGKTRHPKFQLSQCELRHGYLYYRDRLYVPDDDELYAELTRLCHEIPAAGHPGRARTYQLMSRDYYWPGMSAYIRRWVRNCHVCSRTKPNHRGHQGLLQPLPTPERARDYITMDFVTYLPKCQGYDAILVVVDRLTKLRHYIPCHTTDGAEEIARLFTQNIFRLHGRPLDIVSDRDAKFTSDFWQHLSRRLKIKGSPSTAYHPETDGQTERMNAILACHLRSYILPAERLGRVATACRVLRKLHVFRDHRDFTLLGHVRLPAATGNRTVRSDCYARQPRRRELRLRHENDRLDHLKAETALAQSRYEEAANRSRQPAPKFAVGQEVWLDARNLKTLRPKKKLDWKYVGPFKVAAVNGPYTCRLELPSSMKIHPVFNVDLLIPAAADPHTGQRPPPPPLVEVNGFEHFEVEEIVDSFTDRRGRGGKPHLRYTVKWAGYDVPTTEPAWSICEDVPGMVRNFHRRYPDKPRPQTMP